MPAAPAHSNIALMGLRAAGKSTIAPRLATALHLPFLDLDELTAARLDCVDVPEAWSRHGPAAFRAAEVEALRDVLVDPTPAHRQVIALGGGTPTAPGAADLLRAHTHNHSLKLIYLRASPEALRRRLESTDLSTRPSLTGQGVIAEIERLHAERDPLYTELATDIVEVGDLTIDQAVRQITTMVV